MAQLKTLIVTGASRSVGPLYCGNITLSGTLTLMTTNKIQAMSSATATAALYLNSDGGTVYANGQPIPAVYTGTTAPPSSTGKNGDIYIVTS